MNSIDPITFSHAQTHSNAPLVRGKMCPSKSCGVAETAYQNVGHLSKIYWMPNGRYWSGMNVGSLCCPRFSEPMDFLLHTFCSLVHFVMGFFLNFKGLLAYAGKQSSERRYPCILNSGNDSGCPGNACEHPHSDHYYFQCVICNRDEDTVLACETCENVCAHCYYCMNGLQIS